jgi:hypothetical protein
MHDLRKLKTRMPNQSLDLMSALCPLIVLLVIVVAAIGQLKRWAEQNRPLGVSAPLEIRAG